MLFKLIKQEAEGARLKILLSAALSGIANALVVQMLNQGTRTAAHPSLSLFLGFVLSCALYAGCYYVCLQSLSGVFEKALYALRLRIADKIHQAELQGIEQLGAAEIYERITQETGVISQATSPIANGIHAAVLLGFMTLYVAALSKEALSLCILVYGGGALMYSARSQQAEAFMKRASTIQMRLFERLTDMLHGFKEHRLNKQRSEALKRDFGVEAEALRSSTVQANRHNDANIIFANLNLFAVLTAVIFVLPQFISEYPQVLSNLTAAILFMFGDVGSVVIAFPQYERANLAAKNIAELEQKLAQIVGTPFAAQEDPWRGSFKQLQAVNVQYTYPAGVGRDAFTIGPVELSLRAGETIFIVGGNGSGKSTLVKVLTGLYTPTAGAMLIDDVPLKPRNIQAYREMIAAIFSDFHLFQKLYGLAGVSDESVGKLLAKMQIDHKTTSRQGSLSTLELSTGQRKRLAMVIALLEDRPIYVFDEWAADQDPEFRRYYYEGLLPELKRRGKTVIAISHDDRYFHCADRVLRMEEGRVCWAGVVPLPAAPPPT